MHASVRSAPWRSCLALFGTVCFLSPALAAQFKSGDVFREYFWRDRDPWQRVTGPDASEGGAKVFLPNPVNSITIDDLQGATRVEVEIEKVHSHAGTRWPKLRVNGNSWIDIPEPDSQIIPGNRGEARPTSEFQYVRYPIVQIPLAQLRQGSNTFEFTCQGTGGTLIGRIWPQWLVNGATFRVYYGSSKAAPTGSIVSPRSNAQLGDDPSFEVTVSSQVGIARVELLGDYDDFDWRGDEINGDWQYHLDYGVVRRHIGTATGAPWRVTWSTTWIPTQPRPFQVVARIVDRNGYGYVTQPITGLTLARRTTVVRQLSYDIPRQWSSRANMTHSCYTDIKGDLRRLSEARVFMSTWNGYSGDRIGINNVSITSAIGKNHGLDYNTFAVPLQHLRAGQNTLFTWSGTDHHGIDVNWPGMELFVRYDYPEAAASLVTYGAGCAGSNGVPVLMPHGQPILSQSFALDLSRARANAAVTLVFGLSDERSGSWLLPLDMTRAGAPGCWLLAAPDAVLLASSDGAGALRWPVPVPNLPELLAQRLYMQFAVHEPTVNALKLSFSNAARVTISDR